MKTLLLVLTLCIGISGCAAVAVAGSELVGGALSAHQVKEGMNASKSDANIATMVLSAPTSTDVFVQKIRMAITNLGYQVSGVNVVADTRMVLASKMTIHTGVLGFNASSDRTSVAINLGKDNRTISISATVYRNGDEANVTTAEQIAEKFKSQIQKLYIEKS